MKIKRLGFGLMIVSINVFGQWQKTNMLEMIYCNPTLVDVSVLKDGTRILNNKDMVTTFEHPKDSVLNKLENNTKSILMNNGATLYENFNSLKKIENLQEVYRDVYIDNNSLNDKIVSIYAEYDNMGAKKIESIDLYKVWDQNPAYIFLHRIDIRKVAFKVRYTILFKDSVPMVCDIQIRSEKIRGVFFNEQIDQFKQWQLELETLNTINYKPFSLLDNYKGLDTVTVKFYNRNKQQFSQAVLRPQSYFQFSVRLNKALFWLPTLKNGYEYMFRLIPSDFKDQNYNDIKWQQLKGNLLELKNFEAGDYYLEYTYDLADDSAKQSYRLTVLPMWYNTKLFRIILSLLGFLGLGFMFYRRNQQKKMRQLNIINQQYNQKWQAVRNQLNPHFIFNAINSIQGLMLQQKQTEAVKYLGDFAQLLRQPLDEKALAYWSLADELKLLEKYVHLEQLRFAFEYKVNIQQELQLDNIAFPAMLLQPIVENCIKHGISQLKEKGVVQIEIMQENKNLYVVINDNGNGFDKDNILEGNGLKITNQYLAMLNENTKSNKITMQTKVVNGCETLFNFPDKLD
jgi:two-component sensor histidine kinase